MRYRTKSVRDPYLEIGSSLDLGNDWPFRDCIGKRLTARPFEICQPNAGLKLLKTQYLPEIQKWPVVLFG